VEDDAYADGFNTSAAIQTLDELVEGEKPWFLALGFSKPHLPFVAPKHYFDLYDPEQIKLAAQVAPPKDGAAIGLHASFELRTRANIPKEGPIEEELARDLLHAYYACTSYVDAQIGRILAALDEQGVRDNTIIIVWGDHGWHLGDYGIWGKATNYEIATRVPLIIWTPDMKARGEGTNSLVELIDMYPTLCELAGIDSPKHLSGKSLVPVLEDPGASVKDFALSQFPSPALREWAANPLSAGMRETFFGPLIEDVEESVITQQGESWDRDLFENHLMGYALRTDRYRYVEWRDHRDSEAKPVFVELYDHAEDPQETVNVADQNPKIVKELGEQLGESIK
jgi:iduronate 2-sulfatase